MFSVDCCAGGESKSSPMSTSFRWSWSWSKSQVVLVVMVVDAFVRIVLVTHQRTRKKTQTKPDEDAAFPSEADAHFELAGSTEQLKILRAVQTQHH